MTKQDRVINYLSRGRTLSQDSAYSMFEVGGQRDERRKWIQCFNGKKIRK